jgi:hypothetical protein
MKMLRLVGGKMAMGAKLEGSEVPAPWLALEFRFLFFEPQYLQTDQS